VDVKLINLLENSEIFNISSEKFIQNYANLNNNVRIKINYLVNYFGAYIHKNTINSNNKINLLNNTYLREYKPKPISNIEIRNGPIMARILTRFFEFILYITTRYNYLILQNSNRWWNLGKNIPKLSVIGILTSSRDGIRNINMEEVNQNNNINTNNLIENMDNKSTRRVCNSLNPSNKYEGWVKPPHILDRFNKRILIWKNFDWLPAGTSIHPNDYDNDLSLNDSIEKIEEGDFPIEYSDNIPNIKNWEDYMNIGFMGRINLSSNDLSQALINYRNENWLKNPKETREVLINIIDYNQTESFTKMIGEWINNQLIFNNKIIQNVDKLRSTKYGRPTFSVFYYKPEEEANLMLISVERPQCNYPPKLEALYKAIQDTFISSDNLINALGFKEPGGLFVFGRDFLYTKPNTRNAFLPYAIESREDYKLYNGYSSEIIAQILLTKRQNSVYILKERNAIVVQLLNQTNGCFVHCWTMMGKAGLISKEDLKIALTRNENLFNEITSSGQMIMQFKREIYTNPQSKPERIIGDSILNYIPSNAFKDINPNFDKINKDTSPIRKVIFEDKIKVQYYNIEDSSNELRQIPIISDDIRKHDGGNNESAYAYRPEVAESYQMRSEVRTKYHLENKRYVWNEPRPGQE
jgi:hypothetical protein